MPTKRRPPPPAPPPPPPDGLRDHDRLGQRQVPHSAPPPPSPPPPNRSRISLSRCACGERSPPPPLPDRHEFLVGGAARRPTYPPLPAPPRPLPSPPPPYPAPPPPAPLPPPPPPPALEPVDPARSASRIRVLTPTPLATRQEPGSVRQLFGIRTGRRLQASWRHHSTRVPWSRPLPPPLPSLPSPPPPCPTPLHSPVVSFSPFPLCPVFALLRSRAAPLPRELPLRPPLLPCLRLNNSMRSPPILSPPLLSEVRTQTALVTVT